MGICKYCGKSAGWFKSEHQECVVQNAEREKLEAQEKDQFISFVENALRTGEDIDSLDYEILQVQNSNKFGANSKMLLAIAWCRASQYLLRQADPLEDLAQRLKEFADFYKIRVSEFDQAMVSSLMNDAKTGVALSFDRAFESQNDFKPLDHKVQAASSLEIMTDKSMHGLLAAQWQKKAESILAAGVISSDNEKTLAKIISHFGLTQQELDTNGILTKTAKSSILRQVMHGEIPSNAKFDGNIGVNFQKGEEPVWTFSQAKYLEDKVKRETVGRSSGMSVRVARGVYYHVGGSKGHMVEHTERTHVDTGKLVVTNKNIYFVGSRTTTRIPYGKIVSFEPFSDGFGLMRDAASAKAQIFVTGDGWFSFNLVSNLARL